MKRGTIKGLGKEKIEHKDKMEKCFCKSKVKRGLKRAEGNGKKEASYITDRYRLPMMNLALRVSKLYQ